jgi:glycosyltransferase involved in cell wall biosynthesis
MESISEKEHGSNKNIKRKAALTHTATSSEKSVKFEGFVESDNGKKITGWCVGRTNTNGFGESHVLIEIGGKFHKVDASVERPDLVKEFGIKYGAFQFSVPRSLQGLPSVVRFENGTDMPRLCAPAIQHGEGSMDEENDALFQGWAKSHNQLFARVEITANGQLVDEAVASHYRGDLAATGENGYSGFVWKAPPMLRGIGEFALKMQVEDQIIFEERRQFSPIHVLIVSEAEDFSDASRIYRCDNLQVLLQKQGIAAQVIGPSEFHKRNWEHVDIIIFARFGANDETLKKLSHYKKNFGIKIFYEIDDLVFLPWHRHDLGSVRSGVDNANDENLRNMFTARLRLLTLVDGAITTTTGIKRKMEAMGIPCMTIPNLVRSFDIREGKQEDSEALKLLCMSGSPTHYRDFQDIEPTLEKLLTHHVGKVELTLLGRFRSECTLLKLSNVKHINRVPYRKMLQVIDSHHLCLVPLEITDFNNAKSCLKYIECGARGVPVLASPTEDYRRVINHGVNGFIAKSPAEWYQVLEDFVDDKNIVLRAGHLAQKDIKQNFTLESAAFDVKKFITEGL